MSSGRPVHAVAMAVLAVSVLGCGGDSVEHAPPESASAPAAAATVETPPDFTAADLDGYARGVTREMELVRDARAAYDTASTADLRGKLMSAQWESATVPVGAQAAGMTLDRYTAIRKAVHATMRMLDYQGKIDGPTSYDTSRADAAMRERLGRDPYSALPAGAAAVLRAREPDIARLWSDYILLTAVAG